MREFFAIFKYELKKIFGDKKVLVSIILLPVVGALVSACIGHLENRFNSSGTYNVYVIGKGIECTQIEYSDDISVVFKNTDEETAGQIFASDYYEPKDIVVQIGDGDIEIYYNSSEEISKVLSDYVKSILLDDYRMSFFDVHDIKKDVTITNQGEEKAMGSAVMSAFIPYILVLFIFSNVFAYSGESIAGEKERGVFEKNLLTPVSPSVIISAKVVASIAIGLVTSVIYVCAQGLGTVVSSIAGLKDVSGFSGIDISAAKMLLLFTYVMLMCYLFSSIAVLCSLYAKNIKEAKAMLMPVMAVVTMLALMSMLRTGTVSRIMYYVPLYNVCIIIQDILNAVADIGNMIRVVASLTVCSGVILVFTVRSFNREDIRC